MVILQLKIPLELFVKKGDFLPSSEFQSRHDKTDAVESDKKTHSFLSSFLEQILNTNYHIFRLYLVPVLLPCS